jgi:hypothetical protein
VLNGGAKIYFIGGKESEEEIVESLHGLSYDVGSITNTSHRQGTRGSSY